MNILGLNAFHGDASAALLRDGQLVAALEEERLNRVKHWAGFPAEVYLFAALVYFIFCFSMSRYSKYLEVELNKGTRR